MEKGSYTLIVSVAAMVGIGVNRPIAAADRATSLPIVIVVFDLAAVHPAVLDQAEKEAGRIYLHAGVKTTWSRSTPHSSGSNGDQVPSRSAHAFTVHLIIQPTSPKRGNRPTFLMGAAPPTARDCGGTVYVFYDQVEGFSSVQRAEPARVLGTVVAHEVGHLLTRQPGHSANGVMRAPWGSVDWELASKGHLLFSASDAAVIRTTLSSCR